MEIVEGLPRITNGRTAADNHKGRGSPSVRSAAPFPFPTIIRQHICVPTIILGSVSASSLMIRGSISADLGPGRQKSQQSKNHQDGKDNAKRPAKPLLPGMIDPVKEDN